MWIQGKGLTQGRLFGGHTGLCGLKGELRDTLLEITADDFKRKIIFIEDIAEFFSPEQLADFLMWLGNIGALSARYPAYKEKLNNLFFVCCCRKII